MSEQREYLAQQIARKTASATSERMEQERAAEDVVQNARYEIAREKTLDQIAETREKKKEARALRGMAGNTKNEVKKYKAQEKALDKKLAVLAKSKRQQDARVARAKGRAAKAKQRAAKVEKVLFCVPSRLRDVSPLSETYPHAIDAMSSRRTRRLDGVEGAPPPP